MLEHASDPMLIAPLHAYVTDGHQLVYVLESDHSGLIGEDVSSDLLVELSPQQLTREHWRRVYPLAETLPYGVQTA